MTKRVASRYRREAIHYRISGDVDGEDVSKFEQALLDPATAMFEAVAAVAVLTAEEGAAHAARYAVVVRGGVET